MDKYIATVKLGPHPDKPEWQAGELALLIMEVLQEAGLPISNVEVYLEEAGNAVEEEAEEAEGDNKEEEGTEEGTEEEEEYEDAEDMHL